MAKKNPYYIPVPKKVDPSVKARWDSIRACNGSRKKMVNFITDDSGYSDRHTRFAIEYNVKAHYANTDADYLWDLITSDKFDDGPDLSNPVHAAVIRSLFDRVYEEHKEQWFYWGVEEAYESWKDSDMPYETFAGPRVEWEFGLYGRGAGHLCVSSIEGVNTQCSPDDLAERLNEKDRDGDYCVSAETIVKMFILCVQNHHELTPRAVSDEVEYRTAWRLWHGFAADEVKAAVLEYETRERLSADAEAIRDVLVENADQEQRDSFAAICRLAGINIKEE